MTNDVKLVSKIHKTTMWYTNNHKFLNIFIIIKISFEQVNWNNFEKYTLYIWKKKLLSFRDTIYVLHGDLRR